MSFILEAGQTVLFTGDSITDCGRRESDSPLGNGYVHMATDLIAARYPGHGLRFINTGISGNTVKDLSQRWTHDVVDHDPDWLSVMIGINDVWRWISGQGEAAVSPAEFADLYDAILTQVTAETGARLILMDPFYVCADDGGDPERRSMLEHLPEYLATVARMAGKYQALHVHTHDMFQTLLKHYAPAQFCQEPVHPFPSGHMAIAHAWLEAVGW